MDDKDMINEGENGYGSFKEERVEKIKALLEDDVILDILEAISDEGGWVTENEIEEEVDGPVQKNDWQDLQSVGLVEKRYSRVEGDITLLYSHCDVPKYCSRLLPYRNAEES